MLREASTRGSRHERVRRDGRGILRAVVRCDDLQRAAPLICYNSSMTFWQKVAVCYIVAAPLALILLTIGVVWVEGTGYQSDVFLRWLLDFVSVPILALTMFPAFALLALLTLDKWRR